MKEVASPLKYGRVKRVDSSFTDTLVKLEEKLCEEAFSGFSDSTLAAEDRARSILLGFSVLPALELHKWSWRRRPVELREPRPGFPRNPGVSRV